MNAETGPVVRCVGVTKRFGDRFAVNGFDLSVERGSCFALLGPNGAGKTTALRMIYGATPPTSGEIRVFGIDVGRNPRAVRARLGVTLQEDALIEDLSPIENLRVFGRYHCLSKAQLDTRVPELLAFLELESHADVPVRRLSGGFQRRVAVARSLMNAPELLILDEPTTGLDPAVRAALWERIRALRAGGTTVLLTTHYMEEAQRLCDRLAVMDAGRVVAEGSVPELINAHLASEALELELAPRFEVAIGDRIPDTLRLRSGNRLILFVDDAAHLRSQLQNTPELRNAAERATVRPTHMEDVFLALTGTALGEHR